MAKAKKLPSGNWRVQASATIDGKTVRRSFTYSDKKQAEKAALDWQSQTFKFNSNPSELTLGEAILNYIDSRRNILSPVSIATYEKIARNYFHNLQGKKLSNINQKSLQAEINALSGRLSPKSVRSIWGLITASIKHATGESVTVTLPKKQKKIYSTPDLSVSLKILAACKDTEIELPVTLALRMGLRISEVCGLKWSAVHDDYIVIDNVIVTYGKEQYEKPPKSAAGNRKIPLPPDIKELIEKQPKDNDYVVQKSAKAIEDMFRRVLAKNKIPHCRFHDLRHATASAMALLNIPDRYAMKIGGWDSPDVLRSVYQQTFTKEELAFSKTLSDFFTQVSSHSEDLHPEEMHENKN